MNLYASGQMEEVITGIHETVAVAAFVVQTEALTVYRYSRHAAPDEREVIELEPLIDKGVIAIAQLETEAEQLTFVTLSSKRLDDGEAITLALAMERNWAVATNDRAARRLMEREFSQVQLISTPELFKHWQETKRPSPAVLRETLLAVELRANYLVGPRHPLYEWWQAAKSGPGKQ
jgi:hypothetical protein